MGHLSNYIHKKQSGGSGQFAKVTLSVEPLDPGKGREVDNKIKGGAIPKELIPGVEKGFECCRKWNISWFSGYRLQSNYFRLTHDVDSSVLAFEIASRMCFRSMYKSNFKILEPMMKVEVVTQKNLWVMLLEI